MNALIIRQLPGLSDYRESLAAMQVFTEGRTADTPDEIWCLEHPPIYTLGMAGRKEHVLAPGQVDVVKVDRGGQVTFHGPGQLIVYLLIDLKRKGITIKQYVHLLEQAVINMLGDCSIRARRKEKAPGVYVDTRKIAAIGVRVRKGCCYHGLSLNVSMDLSPYNGINPCGYPGLEITQLKDEGINLTVAAAAENLISYLVTELGFAGYRQEILTGIDRSVVNSEEVA